MNTRPLPLGSKRRYANMADTSPKPRTRSTIRPAIVVERRGAPDLEAAGRLLARLVLDRCAAKRPESLPPCDRTRVTR